MLREGQVRIPAGCAISGIFHRDGMREDGTRIMQSIKVMHDRSNGLGGGFAGLEVAEAMCENREITVIEEAKKMGNGIGIIDKNPTINLVKSKGVKLMPLTKLVEVTKKGAKVQNVETGEEQLIECDTVLTSLGVEQNTKLYDEIAKAFPNAKLIGDATTPAGKVYRTLEAVKGGYQASMAL